MNAPVDMPSPMGQAALQYAREGWKIFPCRECDGEPYVNQKGETITPEAKAPYIATGWKAATTDEAAIRKWWRRWPNAMIGLPMGDIGLFAVDFDPRIDEESGEEWTLERLKRELEEQMGCPMPSSLAVRTPSGGVHVYFRQPEGEQIRNRGNLPDHVDVRGRGGYVVAPPSYCEGGAKAAEGRYRWLHGRHDEKPIDAPAALIEILRAPKGRANRPEAGAGTAPTSSSPARRIAGDAAETVRKYAMSALDGELRDLAATPMGDRNNQINARSFSLGQLVGAGALSEAMVRGMLQETVAGFGRDYEKCCQAIENGLLAGIAQPRDLSDIIARAEQRAWHPRRSAAAPAPPRPPVEDEERQASHAGEYGGDDGGGGEGEDEDALDRRCSRLPLTDLGNAERFRARHGNDFLWVPEWGWLAYDDQRWNRDRAEPLVNQAIYQTVRAIGDEADYIASSGNDFVVKEDRKGNVTMYSDLVRQWGRTSESAGHLACVARIAQPWLTARPAEFDADPMKVNLQNWTLEFGTDPASNQPAFRLLPFDRKDKITKIAAVSYDAEAKSPTYDTFLARVQPDPEMRAFLHAWGGYNLTGSISAQKFVLNYGEGANGKSTWIDRVAGLMGDYARTCGIETFIDQGRHRKGGDATPDLAALAGRRMVRTSEPEKGSKFSDGLIKALTGGEPMNVRELNMGFFEMVVTFKVTVSANVKPQIGTDHGIKRRVRLVPWDVTIPDDEQDDQLSEKLKAEDSGILNHLIEGCLEWMRDGLPEPAAITEATREYQEENDPIGRFLALCVKASPGSRVQSTPLYQLFEAWTKWAGEQNSSGKAWSQIWFTKELKRKGFKTMQSNTIQWIDIDTLKQRSDFVDDDGRVIGSSGSSAPDSGERWPPDPRYDDDRPL